MSTKDQIIAELREVYDPEIPINVYDLGLIYEINVKEKHTHVLMTLTSPTCPTAEYLQEIVREAAEKVVGEGNVEVELTFEPPWSPKLVSQEAKEELGIVDTEDITTQAAFTPIEEPIKQKVCFNCGASTNNNPLIQCSYKNEETYICTKCIPKFS